MWSDKYCGSYKIISVKPKRLLKTQIFEKKMHTFQRRKDIGLFFLALSSVTSLMKQFIRIHKVFWQILWKLQDHFCNTGEVVDNTIFWKKKANFPVKKSLWPNCSPIIDCDRPQETIYEARQGIPTITMEVIGSFL